MKLRRAAAYAAALVMLGAVAGGDAQAQLLSPGPLSEPHAELQGIRQCTACHQLGHRGAAADRCLSCHKALSEQLRAAAGYHATVRERTCGSCHAEHYGRDFALIRLDTAAFDHGTTGYVLKDSHARAVCVSCHRPEHVRSEAVRREKRTPAALARTFLGLPSACSGCHAAEDPHGRQFGGDECSTCHRETAWTEATAFDHEGTAFRLTGAHRSTECRACHTAQRGVVLYRGVAHESCTSCHADPHRGAQGSDCSGCHTTDGWRSLGKDFDVARFDHGRTRFPLRAAHARVECGACHRVPARRDAAIRITFARAGGAFAPIVASDCRSCHVSAHPGAEPGRVAGASCAECHGESAWTPASFGSTEHEATRFPLEGAHLLVDCRSCHVPTASRRLGFRRTDISCTACHGDSNPHGRAYVDGRGVTDCARCHVTSSWRPGAVAHDSFPLTGAHEQASCASCHTAERSRAPRECEACHGTADPHGGRSAGRGCAACHGTRSFVTVNFDHGQTRYPLEGAHGAVACRSCHVPERPEHGPLVLRYQPTPIRCEDCHAD